MYANLANLLLRAGSRAGERPAVVHGDRTVWDYAQLADRTAVIAANLRQQLGLAAGDRVALIMRNVPEYVELLFACWHAGVVAVPVNAKLHPREFAYILDNSQARVCFVTPDLAGALGEALESARGVETVIEVAGADYQRLTRGDGMAAAPTRADDMAWLFYTSGTTGKPKGAMLSHRNLMAMTLCYFADVDPVAPTDCIVHAAPMSHGSGIYILPHVAAGAAQVIPASGGFDAEEICGMLDTLQGVGMFAAPTMVNRLIDYPGLADANLANLKTIVYGGGPMYVEDCKRARSILGDRLVQIYGQGESPMTITALPKSYYADESHPRYEARLASVGLAQTTVQLQIGDAEDQPLPPGETGEVLVRGDQVMLGYWRNDAATAESLRNGWLHTGDMGCLDEDGFLTLKARSKEVIISGGVNIYPREIEEVILQDDRVAQVAVVGQKSREWGEEVVCFVVAKPDASVTVEDLEQRCLDNMGRFKRPKRYHFLADLPKNHYGKVVKTELATMFLEETG